MIKNKYKSWLHGQKMKKGKMEIKGERETKSNRQPRTADTAAQGSFTLSPPITA
jgi:hypothetical protein